MQVHPRRLPLMNMQVVSGLMSCILGAAGFTGCTARALCINFVNSAFPLKGVVGFGSCLSQVSHLQQLDVGLTSQLCRSACNPLLSLSLAQSLGSAMQKWKGHIIPQHPLDKIERLEKSLFVRVTLDISPSCQLWGWGGLRGLTLRSEQQFSDVHVILLCSLFLPPLPHLKSDSRWWK